MVLINQGTESFAYLYSVVFIKYSKILVFSWCMLYCSKCPKKKNPLYYNYWNI